MSITIHIYYTGQDGNARKFAEEMMARGIVDDIRNEKGNIRYEYFLPMEDDETVLLVDSWENQQAIDIHHHTPMMQKIMQLREKYSLHMRVERYVSEEVPKVDKEYIKD